MICFKKTPRQWLVDINPNLDDAPQNHGHFWHPSGRIWIKTSLNGQCLLDLLSPQILGVFLVR